MRARRPATPYISSFSLINDHANGTGLTAPFARYIGSSISLCKSMGLGVRRVYPDLTHSEIYLHLVWTPRLVSGKSSTDQTSMVFRTQIASRRRAKAMVLDRWRPRRTRRPLRAYQDDNIASKHPSYLKIVCRRASGARLAAPILPNGPGFEKDLLSHPGPPPREPTEQEAGHQKDQSNKRSVGPRMHGEYDILPSVVFWGRPSRDASQTRRHL